MAMGDESDQGWSGAGRSGRRLGLNKPFMACSDTQSEKRPPSRIPASAAFGHPARHGFRFASFFKQQLVRKTLAHSSAKN
jgi:hypothetical protein